MIKNSTQLISAARKALQRELERCVERGNQPSFYEIYYEGYSEGLSDAANTENVKTDPLTDWHYIELEGNPPTDDRCVILIQCDRYQTVEFGWYDKDQDCYKLEWNPQGLQKVLAWHILPICPEDYERFNDKEQGCH